MRKIFKVLFIFILFAFFNKYNALVIQDKNIIINFYSNNNNINTYLEEDNISLYKVVGNNLVFNNYYHFIFHSYSINNNIYYNNLVNIHDNMNINVYYKDKYSFKILYLSELINSNVYYNNIYITRTDLNNIDYLLNHINNTLYIKINKDCIVYVDIDNIKINNTNCTINSLDFFVYDFLCDSFILNKKCLKDFIIKNNIKSLKFISKELLPYPFLYKLDCINNKYELTIYTNEYYKYYLPSDSSYFFDSLLLENIDIISKIYLHDFSNLSYFFSNCYNLKLLNIEGLVLSNNLNLEYFLNNCSSLEELILGNIDFYKGITIYNNFFNSCFNLYKITISNNNPSNIAHMCICNNYLNKFDWRLGFNLVNKENKFIKLEKFTLKAGYFIIRNKFIFLSNTIIIKNNFLNNGICLEDYEYYLKYIKLYLKSINKKKFRITCNINDINYDESSIIVPRDYKLCIDKFEYIYYLLIKKNLLKIDLDIDLYKTQSIVDFF